MKILLAVDGSADSRLALEALSRFPLESPPQLLLAHVCPVPDLHDLAEELTDQTHRIVEECRRQGEEMLSAAAANCRSWAKSVQVELLSGSPARELVKYAREQNVDLIAAGAHGHSQVERFLLGSVSDALAKHAPCSVLIVRPSKTGNSSAGLRVLVADDGSPEADLAVNRLARLPLPEGSNVLLMFVADTLQAYHTEYTLRTEPALTKLLEKCRRRLEASAAKLAGKTQVSTVVDEGTNAADRILKKAAEWKPDLIVMGSISKSGWEQILLGSVSTRVLQHSESSVWIERAAKR